MSGKSARQKFDHETDVDGQSDFVFLGLADNARLEVLLFHREKAGFGAIDFLHEHRQRVRGGARIEIGQNLPWMYVGSAGFDLPEGTLSGSADSLLSPIAEARELGVSHMGVRLRARDVEGARPGLFVYGTNGRQTKPWGNSTSYRCVIPPLKRETP